MLFADLEFDTCDSMKPELPSSDAAIGAPNRTWAWHQSGGPLNSDEDIHTFFLRGLMIWALVRNAALSAIGALRMLHCLAYSILQCQHE